MPLPHVPRLTTPLPWSPLTDSQWLALLPYLLPRSPVGRKIPDLRARMDAIFQTTATHAPWREAPRDHATPDTIARHYRRLTRAGLWERLPNYPFDEGRPCGPRRTTDASFYSEPPRDSCG